MNKNKWYTNLFIVILVIVFSPILIFGLLLGGVILICQIPQHRKMYKQSLYFKDFGIPYFKYCVSGDSYRFYNSARKRNIEFAYHPTKDGVPEYFIYDEAVFVFPSFSRLVFDEEENLWKAGYAGEEYDYAEEYVKICNIFSEIEPGRKVKVLVERNLIETIDITDLELPEYIYLVGKYETAFVNEDFQLLAKIPQNSRELYEMMLKTPKLCGTIIFNEKKDLIDWDLYSDVKLQIFVDKGDNYINVERKAEYGINKGITHWHPELYDVYNDVCDIGTKGNILIVNKYFLGESVLYYGSEEDCPYLTTKKLKRRFTYYLKAE